MRTIALLLCPFLALLAQAPPASQFPAAVATDATLKVAVNGVNTLLTGNMTTTTTTLSVSACAGIVANTLVTIDAEIMPVSGCTGTVLVVGSRGFDGTVAAAHTSGTIINAFVDAWYHNASRSEIEAIESALGTNLSNVVYSFNGRSSAVTLQSADVAAVEQDLRVSASPVFVGLALGGNETIAGTLNGAAASFSGTLGAGATTLASLGVTGNETIGGTLGVTGVTTLAGLATLNGGIQINGVMGTSGAATLSGGLTVTGGATVNGTLTAANALVASSTLAVTGNTTVGGTLQSTGVYTALAGLTVSAAQPLTFNLGAVHFCTHGSNATCGMAQLSSGAATVSTTAACTLATAGSGCAITLNEQGTTNAGALSTGTVINGTSFVINSSNAGDANYVFWEIRKLN